MTITDVIKRGGERPTEAYERAKLERSIRAAIRSVKSPDGQAEDTASAVCDVVEQWLTDRAEVTSDDLRRQTIASLNRLHPNAAFVYERHKIMF